MAILPRRNARAAAPRLPAFAADARHAGVRSLTSERHHSEACDKDSAAAKAAHEAYFVQWPNACRKCSSWGGHGSSYDPSPSGVGLSPGSMYDFDPCDDCWGKMKCSRCGLDPAWPEDSDGSGACPSCGWTDGTDGAPMDDYECFGECKPENIEAAKRLDQEKEAKALGV